MRLKALSITNYRSVQSAEKIDLGKLTVLIGPNNEGKSNILRALGVCFEVLSVGDDQYMDAVIDGDNAARRQRIRYGRQVDYIWDRDFPIPLQGRKSGLQSRFRITFELNEEECEEFRKDVGIGINGNLIIEILLGKNASVTTKIVKQGPQSERYQRKRHNILEYVRDRISFVYIPAVRTQDELTDIVYNIIRRLIIPTYSDPKISQAYDLIESVQQPVLDRVSARIQTPLQTFLPDVKDVRIGLPKRKRREVFPRDFDFILDDGSPTSIEYKGDGVKSLAAIALLEETSPSRGANIVAIEEPEAHLHSGAIHQLRPIIENLAEKQQVIVTTHNPLFAERLNISANVIVKDGKASSAKTIADVREALGVRVSDNLESAQFVALVEGKSDAAVVQEYFSNNRPSLANLLKSGELVVRGAGGATKVVGAVEHFKQALCETCVLFDGDREGREQAEFIVEQRVLVPARVSQVSIPGMRESELEDYFDVAIYSDKIMSEFGIDLGKAFSSSKSKWSERMRDAAKGSSRPFSKAILAQIKAVVREEVVNAIREKRSLTKNPQSKTLNAFADSVENMVTSSQSR